MTTTEQPVHPVADGIEIHGSLLERWNTILSPDALSFVATLHRQFNATRLDLLARRRDRQADFDSGTLPDFLPETQSVRDGDWQVAPCPDDLEKRWVEITGPCERKMMINALNSGADAFMSDLEDSLAPTWENVVEGQINLHDAVRKEISFENPDGRRYELKDEIATLLVRPRGWHLIEKHLLIDGEPCSASLFDFGLYMFHNAKERRDRGTGPYFYLAKLESHLEARLWNDALNLAQDELGIPRGSARVTVLIETITAAYEMDEILYELRDHISGLNAGRWDYIFSVIKRFRNRADFLLPDRSQISMTVPFMRAYTELLVKTCHRRGAHAMGGMSAFIPNRRDAELNERAMAAVRDDKHRESTDGFDGTWIAHPDLGPVAREEFSKALGDKPNQRERQRDDVIANAAALSSVPETGGSISEEGVRLNVSVALQYLNQWLSGNGAAAINNLMEDAATAEISRAQLWQWLRHSAELKDGRPLTRELYQQIRVEELGELGGANAERYGEAAEMLDGLVLEEEFVDFLTLPAYEHLT